jgi:V8-like Glu-specific endopeptidase
MNSESSKRTRLRLEALEERLVLSPTLIKDSTQYPWGGIVRIEAHFPQKPANVFTEGTGTLIDSYHVLTAGHVLYDTTEGGWADQVRVFPGENGSSNIPFGLAYGAQVRVFHSFIQTDQAGRYNEHDDLALVTLDRTIGNNTGWLGIGYNDDDSYFSQLAFNTAGYPAEQSYSGYDLYLQYGAINGTRSSDASLLSWSYSVLTAIPGQSGSPLWIYDARSGQRTVYGVLVSGDDASKTGFGVRLTQPLYADLTTWMGQDPVPPQNPPGHGAPKIVTTQVDDPTGGPTGPATAQTLSKVVGNTAPAPQPQTGIAAFDPGSATWYLRSQANSGGPDVGTFQYGAPGWIPLAGDWTGDGVTKIGAYDPSTSTFYLRGSNNSGAPTVAVVQFGAPGWVPVVGDWNGDGVTTIGVFDPATATFYLRNSNSPGAPDAGMFQYGAPGWVPLAGDWAGKGTTTIGVFDPGTGTWYLRNSNSSGAPDVGQFIYGLPGWQPVTGNWTSGSQTTIGVIDPSTLTWYLRSSNNAGPPTTTPFPYGLTGWMGLSGAWSTAAEVNSSPTGGGGRAARDRTAPDILTAGDILTANQRQRDAVMQELAAALIAAQASRQG